MTAEQKEIFGSLGLTSEEVEEEARGITLREFRGVWTIRSDLLVCKT